MSDDVDVTRTVALAFQEGKLDVTRLEPSAAGASDGGFSGLVLLLLLPPF